MLVCDDVRTEVCRMLRRLMTHPAPVRAAIRRLIQVSQIGSYRFRYDIGAVDPPNYAYLVNEAAWLAKRLCPDCETIGWAPASESSTIDRRRWPVANPASESAQAAPASGPRW